MRLTHGSGRAHGRRPVWAGASASSLLLQHRHRRHLAVLCSLLLASIFVFVLLEPRHVRVEADGRQFTIRTSLSNNASVLRRSGVSLRAGDRITALESATTDVLRVEHAHTVTLNVDGTAYSVRTHATTIDQLLAEVDVSITGRDSVLQNGQLVSLNGPVEPPRLFATTAPASLTGSTGDDIVIDVRRALPFEVVEDGKVIESTSSRPSVAQALREAGVTLKPGDSVVPEAASALDAGMRVEVQHAKPLTITLPDSHDVVYTLAGTVGDALSAAGVVIPDGAYIDPPANTPVTSGMSVRVVQLSEGNDVEREYIESGTVYEADTSLAFGESRTVKGHDGVRVRHYAVSYANGEEASRDLIDETIEAPVDTVIYYSVASESPPEYQSADAAIDSRSQTAAPTTGGQTLRVYATWYSPASSGRSSRDPAYGVTATGRVVTYGIVAVDPDIIPLGTRLYIPGYGYAVAADVGGAVKGYVIDLGYPDGVKVDWQSKWVEIEVLS